MRQGTMLQKVEYLVDKSGRAAFHQLLELRSDFWSFVEVGKRGVG